MAKTQLVTVVDLERALPATITFRNHTLEPTYIREQTRNGWCLPSDRSRAWWLAHALDGSAVCASRAESLAGSRRASRDEPIRTIPKLARWSVRDLHCPHVVL